VGDVQSTNATIHGRVQEIQGLNDVVSTKTGEARGLTDDMRQVGERVLRTVSGFSLGDANFDKVYRRTERYRNEVQQSLASLADKGIDIFDRNYRYIAGTEPKKFETAYDRACEEMLRALGDAVTVDTEGVRFALAVDENGYAPAHNSKYSKPPTGNPAVDLLESRNKRIFDDDTAISAARSTESSLLQTYLRDTGELLNDLSMPVHVKGRHWGAVRVGVDPASMARN
jgi:methyl-accepting chemotaxis protein